LWIHDEFEKSPARAFILSHMEEMPGMPTPIGIFRQIHKETYDEGIERQIENIKLKKGEGDLEKILFSGNTWEVK
jgi:2-oxoglutarate ferredoxin oxidoreductase subunit beta